LSGQIAVNDVVGQQPLHVPQELFEQPACFADTGVELAQLRGWAAFVANEFHQDRRACRGDRPRHVGSGVVEATDPIELVVDPRGLSDASTEFLFILHRARRPRTAHDAAVLIDRPVLETAPEPGPEVFCRDEPGMTRGAASADEDRGFLAALEAGEHLDD
jgi:hypothetical protein